MRISVFSAKPYDQSFLAAAAEADQIFVFHEAKLSVATARLAEGSQAVCAFVNDDLSAQVLEELARFGIGCIALRCAGFNNVDLRAAEQLGITIARVPAYSPHAVAEHTMALILTLNRKTHRAYNRVREGNFALDGLLGFDLAGKTVGIIGTGKIGEVFARIAAGFGCRILGHDIATNPACEELGMTYVSRQEILGQSDILSLNCPLTPDTRHLINADTVKLLKPGMMLINTSRGAVIDTRAVIDALKVGTIGSLGLDVYEEEADLFFEDLSDEVLQDDLFARLLTFPNVLITGHQAFFTTEAMQSIAQTTVDNIKAFYDTGAPLYPVATSLLSEKR